MMRKWMQSKRHSFTLIELLVVIVILAILLAIALPLYLRAVADSARQTCLSNMQTIAHAEQAFLLRNPAHRYTQNLRRLVGPDQDLTELPSCPRGGDYRVEVEPRGNGFTVICTWPGDGFGNHGSVAYK